MESKRQQSLLSGGGGGNNKPKRTVNAAVQAFDTDALIVLASQQEWVNDDMCSACTLCARTFSTLLRKSHCRVCGKIFCRACAGKKVLLPGYGTHKGERACDPCRTAIERLRSFMREPGAADTLLLNVACSASCVRFELYPPAASESAYTSEVWLSETCEAIMWRAPGKKLTGAATRTLCGIQLGLQSAALQVRLNTKSGCCGLGGGGGNAALQERGDEFFSLVFQDGSSLDCALADATRRARCIKLFKAVLRLVVPFVQRLHATRGGSGSLPSIIAREALRIKSLASAGGKAVERRFDKQRQKRSALKHKYQSME
jgi:hypothetical protein